MASSRLRTIHGVLVQVSGTGILLLGDSGTGKTICALELVAAGHQLVADDVVELRVKDGRLVGNPPAGLRGVANVRPHGLIDITQAFGPAAVAECVPIDLVIQITTDNKKKKQFRFKDFHGFTVIFYDHPLDADGRLTTFLKGLGASHTLFRSNRSTPIYAGKKAR